MASDPCAILKWMDIAGFLGRYPPFDALDRGTLDRIASSVQIQFFPATEVILRQSGEPAKFLYVVRSGAVEILEEDLLIDLLGQGEVFGQFSLLSGLGPNRTVRANEDTICYLIEHDLAEEVFGTPGGLAFVVSSLRRRTASVEEATAPMIGMSGRLAEVGSLVARPPVTCEPALPVEAAASLMAEQRVSCLLVPTGGDIGILTDRDLRTRVLAAGRSPNTPVADVMTPRAETVTQDAMAGEVLLQMLEGGFHHFPVVGRDGLVVGVVSDTDLMGIGRNSPFALKSAIERGADEGAVAAAGRRLPETVCTLVEAGADPVQVGHIVGVTIDALTRRFLQLGVGRLGEPPEPWAWLALGSAARHEQALRTDQDHAMATDSGAIGADETDAYFGALATTVTDGLVAAGIPRCKGDAMAENKALRRPVQGWVRAFEEWMADPSLEGSILSSIAFDYRRVTGPLEVEAALDGVIRTAPDHPQFVRHLFRRALDKRPPTGFFRDLVVQAKGEHVGTLDVKSGGILLIGNLARAYCISSGITERQTLRRLRAAAAAGRLEETDAQNLEDAFRVLWQVRLGHQARCVRQGRTPDDFVDPKTLGPSARQGLKEAFRAILRQQRTVAAKLGVDLR